MTAWRQRRLHFIGMAGAGMSGLALVARSLGATVTGSDRRPGPYARMLRDHDMDVTVGHDPGNVSPDAEIVYSSAVPPGNPERERGRELGLRELRRGELLGELSTLRPCIAVGGAHGKTTTAAMIVEALRGSGHRPGYVVGGILRATGLNADWAEGPWLVVEADESDRSFLQLDVDVAVVTNVELDHQREYRSRLELEGAFREFLAAATQAVVWERPELLALRDGPVVAFDAPRPRLRPDGSSFDWRGIEVRLPVPGAHNARNAVAALEAACLAGADPGPAARALAAFSGTRRRFEHVGETPSGAQVYDDCAIHSNEVRATLEAARTLEPTRLVAVLEPFLLGRARRLAGELGAALACADEVLVLSVYPAKGEDEVAAGRAIAAAAADNAGGAPVAWMPDLDAGERYLRPRLRAGDLCVTLGAGDVGELARRLVEPC